MNKVLTIVVPSYNTEKHIDSCLPTMINDEFIDDIEILLINDGSTDNTKDILCRYEKKYPNSIRVIDKKNGGHGSVINRGIKEAKGKYFKVVDGDDRVITENLGKLVKKLKIISADIVCTPFYEEFIDKNVRRLMYDCRIEEGKKFSFDEISCKINCLSLHAINFRTKILQDNNIKVQEKCYYEDKEYILYPIPFVKTLIYYDLPVYIYRIGVPGQSISIESVIKNKKMLDTITKNLCTFYRKICKDDISEEKLKYISNEICDVIKNEYGMYLKMPYGRKSFELIKDFNKRNKKVSGELYNMGNIGSVALLRKNSFFIYTLAYVMFKFKRYSRGF